MESSPSLKERLAAVLRNEATADVWFVVGDDKERIFAHSQVLSATSESFMGMLYGQFNQERTIAVPDGSAEGFRALLSCENVIRSKGEEVLQSDGFLCLSKDLMASVIGSDELSAGETTVYERVVEWARHTLQRESKNVTPSSIRETLGDALYHIRFPVMAQKDFGEGPAESGILTDKECLALYSWFARGKEPAAFCTKPRKPFTATVNDLIQHLGLGRRRTCPHENEIGLSVETVVSACHELQTSCDHGSASDMWICLRCLKAGCGRKEGSCGFREHSEEEHHLFFVWQNLTYVYCGTCWKLIASK